MGEVFTNVIGECFVVQKFSKVSGSVGETGESLELNCRSHLFLLTNSSKSPLKTKVGAVT